MNQLLTYMLLGALVVGIPLGSISAKCPNDPHLTTPEILAATATWPTIVVAAFTRVTKGDNYKFECQIKAPTP